MAKLTLTDIAAGYNAVATINANNALIEAAIEGLYSLDGTTPNALTANMDANSNKITNLTDGTNNQDAVTLAQLNSYSIAAETAPATAVTIADANSDWVGETLEALLDGLQDGTEGIENLTVFDAGRTDKVVISHDGTDVLITSTNATKVRFGGDAGVDVTNEVGNFEARSGNAFTAFDSTNADFIRISHDGTDADLAFSGTTDLNIRDGVVVKIFDAADAKAMTLNSTGTNFVLDFEGFGGSGSFQLNGSTLGSLAIDVNTNLTVRTNTLGLHVADSAGTDWMRFSHDGTDFNITPTNTTDCNFNTGCTYLFLGDVQANGLLTVLNAGYLQLRTATTAQLNDITALVNTAAGKIQGAVVYNSTTDNPVYATGNTDGAAWVDGAGTTVHTPV